MNSISSNNTAPVIKSQVLTKQVKAINKEQQDDIRFTIVIILVFIFCELLMIPFYFHLNDVMNKNNFENYKPYNCIRTVDSYNYRRKSRECYINFSFDCQTFQTNIKEGNDCGGSLRLSSSNHDQNSIICFEYYQTFLNSTEVTIYYNENYGAIVDKNSLNSSPEVIVSILAALSQFFVLLGASFISYFISKSCLE
jgi:hypothetical protein